MLTHKKLQQVLTEELNKTKSAQDKPLTVEEVGEFLLNYQAKDRVVRSDELSKLVDEQGVRVPMSTGMPDLDQILGGFYEEQVIVITAYPKSGKTSFVLHLIEQMKERNPLFLALEQSPRELIEQMKERKITIPLFYAPLSIDGIDKTTDWIHLKVIESQYRSKDTEFGPTKVAFIDHFGYILQKASSDQVTWEIIRTMQELKTIAKQTKTAIVVIVHTTKGDETEPPTTKDLFGSAGYHQEADTVLSLWRETFKENKKIIKTNNVLLQVLANRKKGETGAVKFMYDNGTFVREEWVDGKNTEDKKANELFKKF